MKSQKDFNYYNLELKFKEMHASTRTTLKGVEHSLLSYIQPLRGCVFSLS
jgi:hypothetical protein